ncbi:hypothetical protein D3H65_04340 [Paraflavitalea soli]|uniref:Uncharacterized protein n=1 Tax=Paraflavitalea soli TaxID=2315862 RepID=A0A3B7MRU3_9BACT|nr:hypothetical protein [Paraflavitalea soli]AXY73251.1 hypothetical protein D3H65_04340 [Paraflavitalea soli]
MPSYHVNASTKRPAELTGEIIDNAYAQQLIEGFRKQFPGEVSRLFIGVNKIFSAVKDIPNVSGIRFMYGMEKVGDPESKVILLIPCDTASAHRPIPNTIVQPQGYLNHRGEIVGLKQTWQLLYNHAVHYAGLMPGVPFRGIMRGTFFGIDSLTSLLKDMTSAHGMYYHFGFDDSITEATAKHKAVLEPLHYDKTSYEWYMDFGSLCPPTCPPPPGGWPKPRIIESPDADNLDFTNLLPSQFNYTGDFSVNNPVVGPLVEMYYYVSPALTEALADSGKVQEVYTALSNNEVRECNRLIEAGNYEAAKELFEQAIDGLMKTYLFR